MKSGAGDRSEYWKLRRDLSDRMAALVKSAEERWLGSARTFLLGSFADPGVEQAVDDLLEEVVHLLQTQLSRSSRAQLRVILSAGPVLSPQELMSELRTICKNETDQVLEKVARLASSRWRDLVGKRRNPIILIVDPAIQAFPWESIPTVYQAHQPVSRVPSLQFLRYNCKP
jgi:hypothetical protein